VAKLAIYAREKMYLRSVPLVLVTELSKIHNGDSIVRHATNGVIKRADEITEILAYYQHSNNRKGVKKLNKLSKQMQKGIADAFNKFDEYQFAKYNRKTDITFKDALFLVHPKRKDESKNELFNKIINDTLEIPYTWEVELSALGQKGLSGTEKEKAVKAKWEELIDSGKLGYMALMRNLRNILQANVSTKHIKLVANTLSDPQKVKKSRQLPFRFLSAYREIGKIGSSYSSYILDALENAVKVSVENLRGFGLETKVVIASDVSASMFKEISQRSTIRMYDIGLLLGMILQSRSDNVITGIFGSEWLRYPLPSNTILANTQSLNRIEGKVGYSTNGFRVIEDLINKNEVVDKVMMFTDCQMWNSYGGSASFDSTWKRYKKIAPNAKLYLFDLAGYGNTPVSTQSNDVYLIAGWSDKIFDVLASIEEGGNAIKEIKKINIFTED
jgi:hypothetical protein